jgi:hypoxia up-regulated 1
MNAFSQKKIMTFNKFTDDFDFHVQHNELDYLGPDAVSSMGATHLAGVKVSG